MSSEIGSHIYRKKEKNMDGDVRIKEGMWKMRHPNNIVMIRIDVRIKEGMCKMRHPNNSVMIRITSMGKAKALMS